MGGNCGTTSERNKGVPKVACHTLVPFRCSHWEENAPSTMGQEERAVKTQLGTNKGTSQSATTLLDKKEPN